jgi:hypothetical protein
MLFLGIPTFKLIKAAELHQFDAAPALEKKNNAAHAPYQIFLAQKVQNSTIEQFGCGSGSSIKNDAALGPAPQRY